MPRMKRVSYELIDNYISEVVRAPSIDRVKQQIVRELLTDGLTNKQREYLLMRYVKGMKGVEIAEVCRVDKSTVSRTLKRARERILKALGTRHLREDFYNYLKSEDCA